MITLDVSAKNDRKVASIDYEKASATFKSFQACHLNESKRKRSFNKDRYIECANKYLSSELSESVKNHLSAWLLFEHKMTTPKQCDILPDSYEYPENANLVLCFDITLGNRTKKAHIYFTDEDNSQKILKIKY